MNPSDILNRWRTVAGLDYHVLVTLLFRGWVIIAGGATVFLLPLWLSPTDQGYYFTFASILALQIFFELGLNQIILQMVSHEVAHLVETGDGRLTGKEAHIARLSSMARLVRRWYAVAAMLFAGIGGAVGAIFFSHQGNQPLSDWLAIWVVLVGATAVNLWLSPRLAMMEGCGKVGHVARLRLGQSVLGYTALWAMLLSGWGLWAATAIPVVGALSTGYWLKAHGNILYWLSSRAADSKHQLTWRKDVFPLQWRIALSWVSGYLIFNLFTPIVFSHYGAIEAGRLGMALAVFSAISTIGMSWVNAKAPNLTMHISRGEWRELNCLFRALFIRSIAVIALMSAGIALVAWYLSHIDSPLMMRIASPSLLAILAIATTINSMVFAMAIYMRAHRKEPMLKQSIVVALLICSSLYWTSKISVFAMMLSYLFVAFLISLPWTIYLFLGYYRQTKNAQ